MVLFRLCVSDYCLIQMSHVQLYHGEKEDDDDDDDDDVRFVLHHHA